MEAEGEISVERHEATGGIKITRETPELEHIHGQSVIIPGSNVVPFLEELAEMQGRTLVDVEVAGAVEKLSKTLKTARDPLPKHTKATIDQDSARWYICPDCGGRCREEHLDSTSDERRCPICSSAVYNPAFTTEAK